MFTQRGLSQRRCFVVWLLLYNSLSLSAPCSKDTQICSHTCSALQLDPSTFSHTVTGTSIPQIQASHCCHGDHVCSVSTPEICLEQSRLPPPHPSLSPASSSTLEDGAHKKKKSHPPFKRHDSSFCCFFFFIHSPTMFGTSDHIPSYSHSYSACPS